MSSGSSLATPRCISPARSDELSSASAAASHSPAATWLGSGLGSGLGLMLGLGLGLGLELGLELGLGLGLGLVARRHLLARLRRLETSGLLRRQLVEHPDRLSVEDHRPWHGGRGGAQHG